jgi:hypothetical protein
MTKEERAFEQQLSGMERLCYALPNANVVMYARLRSAPDVEEVRSALHGFCRRHPLTRVRIEKRDHDSAWFTAAGVPPLEVSPRRLEADEEIQDVVDLQLEAPFELHEGPLVRLLLVRDDHRWWALVCAHHSVCDGHSLQWLISEVLRDADPAQQERSTVVMPPAARQRAPVAPRSSVLFRWFVRRLTKHWERSGREFSLSDIQQLHSTFWRKGSARTLSWSLSREETSALVQTCRAHGVSVTSVLVAAFVVAESRVQPDATTLHGRASVAVDQRSRLEPPAPDAFGNFASVVRDRFGRLERSVFWEASRAVHARLRKKLSGSDVFRPFLLDSMPQGVLDAVTFQTHGLYDDRQVRGLVEKLGMDRIRDGVMVSNLGRADVPPATQIESLHGPFVYSSTIQKYVGVVTWSGRMHFTLCYGEDNLPTGAAVRFTEEAMNILRHATGFTIQ